MSVLQPYCIDCVAVLRSLAAGGAGWLAGCVNGGDAILTLSSTNESNDNDANSVSVGLSH